MCGILGAVASSGRVDVVRFSRQLDTLAHRGPDDSGVWVNRQEDVALGSRRLAVQDLSPAGHMPMSDVSGRVWIVFNGEIYNFQQLRAELAREHYAFKSETDTEVILAAYLQWGESCLDRLDGMFAFAIYDSRPEKNTIFLARDRAGEKPLYYYFREGELAFASELKALIETPFVPRVLDLDALNLYLAYGYVPGETCLLSGVKKLPPSHAVVFSCYTHKLRIWRYWFIPEPAPTTSDPEALATKLGELLRESVRLRLVADVPVGILLSGGLDSSLVTAAAAQVAGQRLRTFTVAFPKHPRQNEQQYALQVARYFATEHYELPVSECSVDLLETLACQFDEPLGDASLLPTYLVAQLTRQKVTVALGGDGGDELFGGYSHYSEAIRSARMRRGVPGFCLRAMGATARRLPVGFKGRAYLSRFASRSEDAAISGCMFDAAARQQIYSESVRNRLNGSVEKAEREKSRFWPETGTLVDRMTRLDFATYLPEDILTKIDRASMAVSLEMRAPFLDRHIVEFAFSDVPGCLKATTRKRKLLPRLLAKKWLPPDFDCDRKQGFGPPLADWLRNRLGSFFQDILSQVSSNLFCPRAVESLLRGQRQGYSNGSRLFALVMFEIWRRNYRVSL